jgi:hypothetical protein
MSIDPAKLPAARVKIQRFLDELCDFMESGKKKSLYQVSVQLFPFNLSSSEPS